MTEDNAPSPAESAEEKLKRTLGEKHGDIADGLLGADLATRRSTLENLIATMGEGICPLLRDALDLVTADAKRIARGDKTDIQIYALYVLAQYRDAESLDAVCRLFRLRGNHLLYNLIGDIMTEESPRLLVSIAGENFDPIRGIVEDSNAYEFARNAALTALGMLMALGRIPREELMLYFERLYDGGLERTHSYVWDELIGLSLRADSRAGRDRRTKMGYGMKWSEAEPKS